MLQQRLEVRRRQSVHGNFVAQGNLGEILFILIFCSCGWAEGRLCSGSEQTELGKRKTLRISERVEHWRERIRH